MDTAASVSHIQGSGSEGALLRETPTFHKEWPMEGGVYGACVVYVSVVYVCLWYVDLCMSIWCGGVVYA